MPRPARIESWKNRLRKWLFFSRKTVVLILGSLHFTLMAGFGIWMWASPKAYEQHQRHLLQPGSDVLPISCTTTDLLGHDVPLSSSTLKDWSLAIYSCFLVPGMNMIIPAVFLLFVQIRFGGWQVPFASSSSAELEFKDKHLSLLPKLLTHKPWFRRFQAVFFGLAFLLAVNMVFIYDIETTLLRTDRNGSQENGESDWTFGQTLALLLLVLPLRDVYEYMISDAKTNYARACTDHLRNAVMAQDLEEVLEAARYADNIQVRVKGEFSSALHFAAFKGDPQLVRLLLKKKAYIDVQGEPYGTPLVLAATHCHEEVSCLLIESDPGTTLRLSDHQGQTALHHAAEQGLVHVIKSLLTYGADADQPAHDGRIPLHFAAENGSKPSVELLLPHCSNVDWEARDGRTPLSYAIGGDYLPIIQLLLEHNADINHAYPGGRTLLSHAAERGDVWEVGTLLHHDADVDHAGVDDRAPLTYAAEAGHEEVVERLLKAEAVIDHASTDGWTPLMYAAYKGRESIVKVLLDHDAEHGRADKNEQTSLILATLQGHESVVRLLLDAGAKLDHVNSVGQTSLSCAASAGHQALVRLLLDRGPETTVNQPDKSGRTALSYAASNNHEAIVRFLLERGAQADQAETDGLTPLMRASREGHQAVVKLLLGYAADVNLVDTKGYSALSFAVISGSEQVVQVLLTHGATTSHPAPGLWDHPFLTYPAMSGFTSMVRLLLDADVDPNKANGKNAFNPLVVACSHGHEDVVRLLLERGANPNQAEYDGRTALSYTHDLRIKQLLHEHGGDTERVGIAGTADARQISHYFGDSSDTGDEEERMTSKSSIKEIAEGLEYPHEDEIAGSMIA